MEDFDDSEIMADIARAKRLVEELKLLKIINPADYGKKVNALRAVVNFMPTDDPDIQGLDEAIADEVLSQLSEDNKMPENVVTETRGDIFEPDPEAYMDGNPDMVPLDDVVESHEGEDVHFRLR